MNLNPVCQRLDELGAPYALIGAHAMAARGYPRFTVDVDLMTTDERVLDRATWMLLESQGATVDPRRGDFDDPLAGVVHILLADGTDIDLVLAKWPWEAAVIARAELMPIRPDLAIRVPRLADLILLKMAAGGFVDLQDAAALLQIGDRESLVAEVHRRLGEVQHDLHAAFEELIGKTRE